MAVDICDCSPSRVKLRSDKGHEDVGRTIPLSDRAGATGQVGQVST